MKYVLSDDALSDLVEIAEYIALDNKKAALKLMKKFRETFKHLTEMPHIGRRNKNLTDKDVLFWNVKKYLIIYQIKDSGIDIVRVLSSFRDIAGILD